MSKVFAVAKGRQVGVFDTWAECNQQVTGFPGAKFKKIARHDVQTYMRENGVEWPLSQQQSSIAAEYLQTSMPAAYPVQPAHHYAHQSVSPSAVAFLLCFDGGARGNPGPAGAGSVVYAVGGQGQPEKLWEKSTYTGHATNNEAEYTGLIEGLRWAAGVGIFNGLSVRGDSQLVICQMTGKYAVKAANLQPLHSEARALAQRLGRINWEHIPRDRNSVADGLGNKAVDEQADSAHEFSACRQYFSRPGSGSKRGHEDERSSSAGAGGASFGPGPSKRTKTHVVVQDDEVVAGEDEDHKNDSDDDDVNLQGLLHSSLGRGGTGGGASNAISGSGTGSGRASEGGASSGSANVHSARTAEAEVLSTEQQAALDLALGGRSFFFTGSAGTGKSFLLRRVIRELKALHAYRPDGSGVYVTAPTGIAACNIGGVTIHSFAGIGIDADTKSDEDLATDIMIRQGPFYDAVRHRWKSAQVLVIDEVSMLDGNLFDKLEHIARRVRGMEGLPFGGIQLVLAGDFFQLPPIGVASGGVGGNPRFSRGGDTDKVPAKFCFQAQCWNAVLHAQISLQKVFRQKDDRFVRLLNSLREGRVDADTTRILNSCGQGMMLLGDSASSSRSCPEIKPTMLYSKNVNVDEINASEIARCSGEMWTWQASGGGERAYYDALIRSCPAPETLELKVGAQVMLLRNVNVASGLVNGARGVVTAFKENTDARGKGPKTLPVVKFKLMSDGAPLAGADGADAEIELTLDVAKWNTMLGDNEMAWRTQIPLKLAYALTVHKSQGMTIDMLEVDLSSVFEFGQAYVALSRAVSLDRLRVYGFNPAKVKAHSDVILFYDALKLKSKKSEARGQGYPSYSGVSAGRPSSGGAGVGGAAGHSEARPVHGTGAADAAGRQAAVASLRSSQVRTLLASHGIQPTGLLEKEEWVRALVQGVEAGRVPWGKVQEALARSTMR